MHEPRIEGAPLSSGDGSNDIEIPSPMHRLERLSRPERLSPYVRNAVKALAVSCAMLLGSDPSFAAEKERVSKTHRKQKTSVTESVESPVIDQSLSSRINRIWSQFGSYGADPLILLSAGYERSELARTPIETTDFQVSVVLPDRGPRGQFLYGQMKLPAEAIREILIETYPKGWVESEISSVRQVDETGNADPVYGLKDAVLLAECATSHGGMSALTFYQPTRTIPYGTVLSQILAHELGHANDWENDHELAATDRADLLIRIGERMRSENRHTSWYVEAISNEDAELEAYLKAKEYWAEIVAQYFRDPSALHVDDYALVDDFIRRTDPEFDRKENTSKRWGITETRGLAIDDRASTIQW